MNDRNLIEARNDSIAVEAAAALDLKFNADSYLDPSWTVRRVIEGYERYTKTRLNSHETYMAFREMFSETRGKSHQTFSNVIKKYVPTLDFSHLDTMFKVKDVESTVKSGLYHLNNHGFFKSNLVLPPDILESLKSKVIGRLEDEYKSDVEGALLGKEDAPLQLKLGSAPMTLIEEMYEIAADPILLRIVQEYFGVPPIYTNPVAFVSSFKDIKKERELSDTAQLYHHDMRKLKFVKIFIYLTDVDASSGPHTLLSGTHRHRPDALWADGRHTDEVIEAAGLKEQEVQIEGPAGTVFLVDTSALHKGANPLSKPRIMAQIQYTNTLFGYPFPQSERKIELFNNKQDSASSRLRKSARLTRHYANKVGVRFMQNFI